MTRKGSPPPSYVSRLTLAIVLGIVLLGGCSGGGGGSPAKRLTHSYQSDTTAVTQDLLSLSLNTTETTQNLIVLDLLGTQLDITDASGISADVTFDSTKMTFSGFEGDNAGLGTGMAALLETDTNTVVLGLYSLKAANGRLGKLKFQSNRTAGQSDPLSFSSVAYIAPSSSLLPIPAMTGLGGTLQTN